MCNCLFLLTIEPPFQYRLARLHPLPLVLASRTTPVQLLEPIREITIVFIVIFPLSNLVSSLRSTGAVASLYDLACISQSPEFDDIQDLAFDLWNASPGPANRTPPKSSSFLGNHFFITSPSGTGLSPVWDYRAGAAKGNPDAFVLAAKVADVPAPTSVQDVDWLQLKSVSGSLATQVCNCAPSVRLKLIHLFVRRFIELILEEVVRLLQ